MYGGAVAWCSRKQTVVALSTVEAEFVAASIASQDAIWTRQFFASIGQELRDPTPIHVDNQGAIKLIKTGNINSRTKHINTRFRSICHWEETGNIKVDHVRTNDQVADVLTKSLGGVKFKAFTDLLGVRE